MAERRLPCLLIIADDLTGAADCAARCRHAGLHSVIHLAPPTQLPAGQAHAVSTDTRHLTPDAAGRAVFTMVMELAARAADVGQDIRWYKKIDSTLRGHLGFEIDAVLAALLDRGSPIKAIVCPAFPAQGRGLQDGYLVYSGSSPSARHLPSLLHQQSRLSITAIPLSIVRSSPTRLRRTIASAAQTRSIIVADATSDEDLFALVDAATNVLPDALLVGSAGMVAILADRMVGDCDPGATPGELEAGGVFPVAVIVGSGSEMAHRQIRALADQPHVATIQIAQDRPFQPPVDVMSRRVHLLHLPEPDPAEMLEGTQARAFASMLADAAIEMIQAMQPQRIILVGGDTTINVLNRLQIQELIVVWELLPGMPLVTGQTPDGTKLEFILKAGNHGTDTTLVDLAFGSTQ